MTLPIATIVASTRPNRFGVTVARWFAGVAAERDDLAATAVDLAATELPAAIPAGRDARVDRLRHALAAAEGFVVITPEYNHSFPAPLKQAIDLTPDVWEAKPVAFVSYGGISGGLRAVEQLRQVLAELHAVTVRDTVSFAGVPGCFDAHGRPRDAEAVQAAAGRMLDSLGWWARALRAARHREPYVA